MSRKPPFWLLYFTLGAFYASLGWGTFMAFISILNGLWWVIPLWALWVLVVTWLILAVHRKLRADKSRWNPA